MVKGNSSHASGVRFLGIPFSRGLRSLRSLNPRLCSLHASGVQFVPLDLRVQGRASQLAIEPGTFHIGQYTLNIGQLL